MHFLTQPTALLVLGGLLLLIGAVAGWRLRRSDVDATAVTLNRMLHGELEQLRTALEEKTRECDDALVLAADEKRRRVEVVEMIALVENDRNAWKQRYWEAGLGHSAAQELLMRQIIKQRAMLRKHKIEIPRDSANCDQTVEAYRLAHVAQNEPENSVRIPVGVDVASSPAPGVESAPKC